VLSSLSSNAILAKSRAMYGKRLTFQSYNDLSGCKSVADIAAYLKNRTFYSDIFEGVSLTGIHRGQLELLLSKHAFRQFELLCKYELSIGQDFYKYFITRNDIDMILTCVRLLNTGNPEDFLLYMPVFFGEYTKIDQVKLAKVRSIDDLLDALDGTEYRAVIEPFAVNFDAIKGKLNIEAALNRYKFESLKKIAEKDFRGKQAKEVIEVFKIQNDIRVIINIYRLKKMIGADKDVIKQFIMPEVSRLPVKKLKAIAESANENEMLERLKATVYGKVLNITDFDYFEDAAQRYLYKWSLKMLRFSTNPTVVMFCYVFLLENEINNITHIIEGIRYGFPSADIRDMLIGIES
jgi:V/A-type H+-transporting ATPase subunit C